MEDQQFTSKQDGKNRNSEKEDSEKSETKAINDKNNPIVQEEKAPQQMENPYENQEQDEKYEIDGVPEKPRMGDIQPDDNQSDEEEKQDPNNMQQQEGEGEGEGEMNLTDEEVFEIAENALLKVAH